jgi:3,4-dihydroxy 2-butanone 4-phosphate synthase/GTP cyclohydrolase II
MANLNPSGVICEILNDDGTMARKPDLTRFCHRYGLKMFTISDIVEYRLRCERVRLRGSTGPKPAVPTAGYEQCNLGCAR